MLFDPHDVADLELVLLVVRVVFLRPAHRLLEQRMSEAALHAHHQCLVLLVAYDDALERSLRHIDPLNSSLRLVSPDALSARPSSIARCRAALRARVRCFPVARWRAGSAG